ncbi:hypothetical protein O6P43_010424 [Quillaja saponaria]|uniref:Uncharacterized protein n=1 Tax=Quillaja saponaria TaxID=32244 RepID=A0AAD7Q0E4_QUISA|nr:hypothetical protein O6P43_010424 [Quillaja saponaria]
MVNVIATVINQRFTAMESKMETMDARFSGIDTSLQELKMDTASKLQEMKMDTALQLQSMMDASNLKFQEVMDAMANLRSSTTNHYPPHPEPPNPVRPPIFPNPPIQQPENVHRPYWYGKDAR